MLSVKHACSEPFRLAYKKPMHAFCQASLLRAIYSCLQGANARLLTSMFAQNYFLFPTWNLDILSTKDACSGDSPRQRRTEACVPANTSFVQSHFRFFEKSWFNCIMQALRCNFQWWTIRSSLNIIVTVKLCTHTRKSHTMKKLSYVSMG